MPERLRVFCAPWVTMKKARGLIRVSLGRFNTRDQVLQFLNILENVAAKSFRRWASAVSARPESAYEQEFQSTNC